MAQFSHSTIVVFFIFTLLSPTLSHPDTFNITLSYDLKYALVDYATHWWNARYFCYDLFQQDLATIHNKEDNDEAFSVCPSRNCWIGGTNLFLSNISNYTQWIDGTQYDYNPNPLNYTAINDQIFGCTRYDNSSYWGTTDCLSLQYIELPFICAQNDTLSPTDSPSRSPSLNPTSSPTNPPTNSPTMAPTVAPSNSPTQPPTHAPTQPPTNNPSLNPSFSPSSAPTMPPTNNPSLNPTYSPSQNPTYSPSIAPSNAPSSAPSAAPTTPPSNAPSTSPTQPPSAAPSFPPTNAPSLSPTASPLFTPCVLDYNLDLIFLVDTSCGITETECRDQQTFISSLLQKSKSHVFPRLGYIEFDDVIDEPIFLNDSRYNINSTLLATNLVQLITDTENADCTPSAPTNTSTETAIIAAIQQFDDYSAPLGHDKKIILISNCPATDDPCDTTQDLYDTNIDVIIVNIGPQVTNTTYSCLSENDPRRIFYSSGFNSLSANLTEAISREICEAPTPSPTDSPTLAPTLAPSSAPTSQTLSPSNAPSIAPSNTPSITPSNAPTQPPSNAPSMAPSIAPSNAPSMAPSIAPSVAPSTAPSSAPTTPPSNAPSFSPTLTPSSSPTTPPTSNPTPQTTGPTQSPSDSPSSSPTNYPTFSPSSNPTQPPSMSPTVNPTYSPSAAPSVNPTMSPSGSPTQPPTQYPSGSPTQPPTKAPTAPPTNYPSSAPTSPPTNNPTMAPTPPTLSPSSAPTSPPSNAPTHAPTISTDSPTPSPTTNVNECYGSNYIFCYFMDISLREFVQEFVTTDAAGDNAISFTQKIVNVPVSPVIDITYIIRWRPINYPCYNPHVSIGFRRIEDTVPFDVLKFNQDYDIANNLTSETTLIGQCVADSVDCDSYVYEDCTLSDNLDVAIIDTNEWYGVNLTEFASAKGVCIINDNAISMDVEVTLSCDLEPSEPEGVKPEFIASVIEEIQCNDTIAYRSNALGATTNYYNVMMGSHQSNITLHLCISEENTSLAIHEWNGKEYNEKFIESPVFDNISAFDVFDELTVCFDGYYAQIVDDYILASNDYYYVGVIVNGMVYDNPYEYVLVLQCNSYRPIDINAEQEPLQCILYPLHDLLFPLIVYVSLISFIVFVLELIYYIRTTHKLFSIKVQTEATFSSIFNKATNCNKFLYVLDFVSLFICICLVFFIFLSDDLKGSLLFNVEIYIIGGIATLLAALFGSVLVYIKWKRFLSLYFVVMNDDNRIHYFKQMILYDLLSAALQDGIMCITLLLILSKICTNKSWLYWILCTLFILYFIWFHWKVFRCIYALRSSSKHHQHENKESMLAQVNDNEKIIQEFDAKPMMQSEFPELFPQNTPQKAYVEMPAMDDLMDPNLDVSLTMEIKDKSASNKEESHPQNTNYGLGEGGDDDLMLPNARGIGYHYTPGADKDGGNDEEENKQQMDLSQLIHLSHYRERVVHSHYIKVCNKLMERYDTLSEENKQRHCELASSGINAISAVFHGIFVENEFNASFNIVIGGDLYYDSETLINYFKMRYKSMNLNVLFINDISNSIEITLLFESEILKNGNNILFIESCTNPHGNMFNFDFIPRFKSVSSLSYVIVDNTLLTSSIFNPFKHGADIVVLSLSKLYSGGNTKCGAILCNSHIKNTKLMSFISNWITINGIHISPFYCKWILQNIEIMDKRMKHILVITRNIVYYLRDIINEGRFKGKLVIINHPFLTNHESNELCKKYCGSDGPSIIAIKIALKNHNLVQKWLSQSKIIKKQISFGKKETSFDFAVQIVNDGTWCKLSIGWNISIDDIKKELNDMFQSLP